MATVFKPSAIVKEIEKSGGNPTSVFSLELRKNQKVYTTGGGNTTYRDMKARVGTRVGKVTAKNVVYWESNSPDVYIEITKGAIDPSKSEIKKSEGKSNTTSIQTTISKAHDLGVYQDLSDRAFTEIVEAKSQLPADNPEWIKLFNITTRGGKEMVQVERTIKTPVRRVYSNQPKVPEELRGKNRDDPAIDWDLDFSKYPATFGRQANMPKTIVRDYDKPISTRDGRVVYAEATVMDSDGREVSLNAANAYKFLTRGSQIYRITIDQSTVAISNDWVSNKTLVTDIVVRSRNGSGETTVIGEDGNVEFTINENGETDSAASGGAGAGTPNVSATAANSGSANGVPAAPTAAESAMYSATPVQSGGLDPEAIEKMLKSM
jgi:hypothetical protein